MHAQYTTRTNTHKSVRVRKNRTFYLFPPSFPFQTSTITMAARERESERARERERAKERVRERHGAHIRSSVRTFALVLAQVLRPRRARLVQTGVLDPQRH
jgi:hypothetical protein